MPKHHTLVLPMSGEHSQYQHRLESTYENRNKFRNIFLDKICLWKICFERNMFMKIMVGGKSFYENYFG